MSIIKGNIPTDFQTIRQKANQTLSGIDFPGAKDEEWKYTKVGKLKSKNFNLNSDVKVDLENCSVFEKAHSRIVFVNGNYNNELSKNSNSLVKRIAELTEEELNAKLKLTGYVKEGIFTSYNDAFFTDGVVIEISKNEKQNGVIEILFISTSSANATVSKNLLIAHEGSEADVLFNFQSVNAQENLVNFALHASIAPNAKLTVYKLQQELAGVSHFSSENIFQQDNSTFEIHTVTLFGDLVRNDLSIKVDGENCQTHLGGVFIADGKMHVDNHTMVDHQKPNCESNEVYKGIANDNGVGVFNGKIFVRRDAQKINAYQNSANVLLSDDASIYSKPELEIYADDVKCSHGTTTGCLDEAALFYLQARGISQDSARNMLVQAFAADMIEKIVNDEIRLWMVDLLNSKLERN